MIILRQKEYTIQEGHYTGPKDQDKLPGALETISKSALGGAIIGAIIGKIDKDSTILKGSTKGAGYGTLAGLGLKLVLNYIHKPMSRVKYNEVDKIIRREFGIYRVVDITFGDKLSKRADLEEKFSFNDRNVGSYKLNFSIQDDRVTMYTLGISDQELKDINQVLDYYCKKYFGMEYTSTIINQNINSYSVTITFTNYQVISNFIIELSEKVDTKINLLNCDALVKARVEGDQRNFSFSQFTKSDIGDIILTAAKNLDLVPGDIVSSTFMGLLIGLSHKLRNRNNEDNPDASLISGEINNIYLEKRLNKLYYIEGVHYTKGDKKAKTNISIIRGNLIVTVPKNSEDCKKLDPVLKSKFTRKDTGKVIVYIYKIASRQEFDFLLKKLMSTKIKVNIYDNN